MGILLQIRPEPGFLMVGATGEFSLQEAKRTFLELLEAVVEHKARKVIFDGRRITGNPETIERFYYGEFAAGAVLKLEAQGVFPGTKFAYVLKEPVLDPERLGETVAVNRGMFVRAFDSLEDAFGWIGKTPDGKPDAAGS